MRAVRGWSLSPGRPPYARPVVPFGVFLVVRSVNCDSWRPAGLLVCSTTACEQQCSLITFRPQVRQHHPGRMAHDAAGL